MARYTESNKCTTDCTPELSLEEEVYSEIGVGEDNSLNTKDLKKHEYWIDFDESGCNSIEDWEELIVLENQRLVHWWVNKIRVYFPESSYEDLAQEGNYGLVRALRGYDRDRGIAFSTYASWWIRGMLARATNYREFMINIPIHKRNELRKKGITPGSNKGLVQAAIVMLNPVVSLNAPYYDGAEEDLINIYPDSGDQYDRWMAVEDSKSAIREAHLTPREKICLQLDFCGYTALEIKEILHIESSESAIRKSQKNGKEKLKKYYSSIEA